MHRVAHRQQGLVIARNLRQLSMRLDRRVAQRPVVGEVPLRELDEVLEVLEERRLVGLEVGIDDLKLRRVEGGDVREDVGDAQARLARQGAAREAVPRNIHMETSSSVGKVCFGIISAPQFLHAVREIEASVWAIDIRLLGKPLALNKSLGA